MTKPNNCLIGIHIHILTVLTHADDVSPGQEAITGCMKL